MTAPTLEDITKQTDRELRARRFLDDHGLKLAVKYEAPSRYRATIRRGHKSFSLSLPADNGHPRPTAYDALAALLIRAAFNPHFERRARTFFGNREIEEMEKVL